MIDKQKLINFLELRATHHRQTQKSKGFEEYCDGAKKEAIMLSEMIRNGEFDVEEDDE